MLGCIGSIIMLESYIESVLQLLFEWSKPVALRVLHFGSFVA